MKAATVANAPRVVFAGGGTGGHLTPGVQVARALAERAGDDGRFLFLRGKRRVEALVLSDAPGETRPLPGLRAPVGIGGRLAFVAKLPAMFARSIWILQRFKADTVIGLGGYGAVPAVLAGRALGCRVVLLEQNVKPGLANRLLGPLAHHVCCAHEATAAAFRAGVRTGNPVRAIERTDAGREAACRRFGFDPDRITLLVVGGSQGAQGLNTLVCDNLGALTPLADRLQVLHIAGERDRERVAEGYRRFGLCARVEAFVTDMELAYRVADAALCRAGGTTIAELAVAGLPAVLVPYPHHRDRHQYENARAFADAGAGFVLDECDADAVRFRATIGRLLEDPSLRTQASVRARAIGCPSAAADVASVVLGQRRFDEGVAVTADDSGRTIDAAT